VSCAWLGQQGFDLLSHAALIKLYLQDEEPAEEPELP
jgi:hypothetical protein